MATINEVIERVDRVKVNPYEDIDKARWLIGLEGQVYNELTLYPVGARGPVGHCPLCGGRELEWSPDNDLTVCRSCGWSNAGDLPPRVWPEDGDKPLLVPAPYDELYDLYLFAMIDYHDREYGGYNNDMEQFNAAFGAFRRHWWRRQTPRSVGGWKGRL